MKLSATYKNRDRMVQQVRYIVDTVRHFHQSHADMVDRLKECVWEQPAYRRLTNVQRGYVDGVTEQLLFENLRLLDYRHLYHGRWVTPAMAEAENSGKLPTDFYPHVSQHDGKQFWIGTDRPFY